jgi:hypothetical protein
VLSNAKKLFYYYYFYRGPDKTSLTVNQAKTNHFVRDKYCQEVILYRIRVHFEDNTQNHIAINKNKTEASRKLCLMNEQTASLIREQCHNNTMKMEVSIPLYKRRKFSLAYKDEFFIHLSLLGGFLGLIGYLAVVCQHVH